jgi:hypothetical protein
MIYYCRFCKTKKQTEDDLLAKAMRASEKVISIEVRYKNV